MLHKGVYVVKAKAKFVALVDFGTCWLAV